MSETIGKSKNVGSGKGNVTEQAPTGPSLQAFPCILCFSSSLKYRDNSTWCTVPELFCCCENPHQKEGDIYLMIGEHRAPGLLELRTNNVNPCDITWLPHHWLIRELCTSWDIPLTLVLKMLCCNPGSSEHLRVGATCLPAINLSLP